MSHQYLSIPSIYYLLFYFIADDRLHIFIYLYLYLFIYIIYITKVIYFYDGECTGHHHSSHIGDRALIACVINSVVK
jgi:hypothetical protein